MWFLKLYITRDIPVSKVNVYDQDFRVRNPFLIWQWTDKLRSERSKTDGVSDLCKYPYQ